MSNQLALPPADKEEVVIIKQPSQETTMPKPKRALLIDLNETYDDDGSCWRRTTTTTTHQVSRNLLLIATQGRKNNLFRLETHRDLPTFSHCLSIMHLFGLGTFLLLLPKITELAPTTAMAPPDYLVSGLGMCNLWLIIIAHIHPVSAQDNRQKPETGMDMGSGD
ncbi:unnamed protein product [Microthlaspi erraticum]|uniref:Uncharacterized protein n=1 Tax=Microthlaspi erraticum TaxID=1685480 RepID=A0A6D2HXG1_9BRAS|nr:unnamed protein product [Microthlaspi erraticum]